MFFAALAVFGLVRGAGAINASLTQRDIERAFAIANGPDGGRAQFHKPYIIVVGDPVVEQVEVVTEFRRYVLASEEQLKLGNWTVARGSRSLGGRGIVDDLQPWKGKVTIQTRLRFHPQNTYNNVPQLDTLVGEPPMTPLDVIRSPLLGFNTPGRVGAPAPVLGALVEATFDAGSIGQTSRPVRIVLDGQEIKRLTIDFSRLE